MPGPAAALPAVVLAASLVAGCDLREPPSDDDLAERDARAVAHGTDSLDGTPRLAYFGALFALPPGLDATDPEAVRRDAVMAVHQRLTATFAALGCDAAVETDDESRVSMTLQGCRLLVWTLDTDLDAVARVETAPCDAGTCATAVTWELDIGEMVTRIGELPPSRFSGPAELRAPVDATEPMQWHTHAGFVLETRLGLRFEALSSASFRIDDDSCIDLDLGARLALEELPEADRATDRMDALDERIGHVVVSARGLRRCPGRCPEAGRVELSFGAGHVLAWTHDGRETIEVQGPRGRQLQARLPCADEASASAGG